LLLAAAVTVWSLGELAQWPVAAYTTSLAPPGMTGRYAGARSLCYGLALLLAPLAGTALYNLSPAALWGACAAAGICAAAVITPATRQHSGHDAARCSAPELPGTGRTPDGPRKSGIPAGRAGRLTGLDPQPAAQRDSRGGRK